ncbi:zinc ABC transporter permease AztB [Nocardia thailandica]|uniref:zinc ABC transporter permease AztB n=1 Tax=Nocardia thailandica TaxID=257275 RepID=UPI0002DC541E|nr:zinc ABC transporter permease AztB [Nocardia thailandica]
MEILFVPFEVAFVQRALWAGLLVSCVCAVAGTWVVVRGMAFLGDAMAHGMLPGVAVAALLGGSPLLGAAISCAAMAAGVSLLGRNRRFAPDTAIGLLFAGMLALGVILVSRSQSFAVDLTGFLFGDVLAVRARDLWFLAAALAVAVAVAALGHRAFVALAFDPRKAETLGLRPRLAQAALVGLLTLAIVASFHIVGTLLVFGLLIAPPAAAVSWTDRIPVVMLLAAALGGVATAAGLLISWHAQVAAGACIAATAVGLFFLSAIAAAVRDRITGHRGHPDSGGDTPDETSAGLPGRSRAGAVDEGEPSSAGSGTAGSGTAGSAGMDVTETAGSPGEKPTDPPGAATTGVCVSPSVGVECTESAGSRGSGSTGAEGEGSASAAIARCGDSAGSVRSAPPSSGRGALSAGEFVRTPFTPVGRPVGSLGESAQIRSAAAAEAGRTAGSVGGPSRARWWSRRRRPVAGLALAALLPVIGCAATESGPVAEAPHGYVEGAEETADEQLRLVLAGTDGAVRVLDLLTEEVTALGSGAAVTTIADDGRFAYLSTAAGVRVVDSGGWTVDHGDHSHYYRAPVREIGTLAGRGREITFAHGDPAVTVLGSSGPQATGTAETPDPQAPRAADAPGTPATTTPGTAQEPPGTAQEPPGAAQEPPGAAQEPPGAAQEPPGTAQEPPGTAQAPPGTGEAPPGGQTPSPASTAPSPTSPASPRAADTATRGTAPSASVLDRAALDGGQLPRATELGALAVPYDERLVTVSQAGVVEVRGRDGGAGERVDIACPRPRGQAVTRRGAVFGCADGAVVVARRDGALVAEKIAYPPAVPDDERVTAFTHRPGSTVLTALAGRDAVWSLDIRAKTWTRVPVPDAVAVSTAGEGAPLLVLTRDGVLRAFDPRTGAPGAQVPLLAPPAPGDPAPALVVDPNRAYVNDFRGRRVHEIAYNDNLRVARVFDLDIAPAHLTETGL